MKKISKNELDNVITDWQYQFPQLKRYKDSQKLLKRVGHVIIGIELEKYLSDTYRPRFIVINLLDDLNKTQVFCIDQAIKNKNNLIETIRYSVHKNLYMKTSQLLKKQSYLDLNDNLSIETIIDSILEFIKRDLIGNPYFSCLAVMQLSRAIDNQQLKDQYFDNALQALEKVPRTLLETHTNGFEKWVEKRRNTTKQELLEAEQKNIVKYKFDFL